eukprot:10214025-Alexandrium_andersonii.AAC.1
MANPRSSAPVAACACARESTYCKRLPVVVAVAQQCIPACEHCTPVNLIYAQSLPACCTRPCRN